MGKKLYRRLNDMMWSPKMLLVTILGLLTYQWWFMLSNNYPIWDILTIQLFGVLIIWTVHIRGLALGMISVMVNKKLQEFLSDTEDDIDRHIKTSFNKRKGN